MTKVAGNWAKYYGDLSRARNAVFVRSLAARGHLGGLSAAASRVVDVLDAAGKDLIIIETVGVGQSETEVSGLAQVTVLVCAPGMGDEVQMIKAGVSKRGRLCRRPARSPRPHPATAGSEPSR
jgi:putative protein kinase ArgK-like GTPase of G3E family